MSKSPEDDTVVRNCAVKILDYEMSIDRHKGAIALLRTKALKERNKARAIMQARENGQISL